jgi:hypothetical protein
LTLSALALLVCAAVCVAWVRGYWFYRFEGLTYNSTRLPDDGQMHFCISTGAVGVTFSHHRLREAILDVGWFPFSAECARVSAATMRDWYLKHGGSGSIGIWWLAGSPRDDEKGFIYEIFFPHWVLVWLIAAI